jgi:N-acetylmuramoyl-L-alanine amidase
MKKLLIVLLAFISVSISAQTSFSGLKICVNPGHGGHDSDDREIVETGFWESEGNLGKGLHLRDILLEYGASVVMTRVTNTTADDLALSQIVAIANNNNVDWMHAIHSNAYDNKSDYTLGLFQGNTSKPTYTGCDVMATDLVDEICKAQRTTSKMIAGDFDFYGTGKAYLGVFKGLNMGGTLSEGEFHDYYPMSWRLRNDLFLKHEAWAIARAFTRYWNRSTFSEGIAAGIIRDKFTAGKYTNVISGDELKPVNNIKVTLTPGNKVCYGDTLNNGFYMFDSLAPGTYKLVFEANTYSKDSATVTVTAGKTVFADAYLVYDPNSAPLVNSYSPLKNAGDSVIASAPIVINFSRPMDTTSTKAAFSITPAVQGAITWSNSNQVLTFTPAFSYVKATTYKVTIAKTALSQWNVALQNDFTFSFLTKNKDRFSCINSFPANGQKDVSNTAQMQFKFDSQISSSTGAINFFDAQNNAISVKNSKTFNLDGNGYIFFEPTTELQKNTQYKAVIYGTVKDVNNLPLYDTVTVSFTTSNETYVSGTVVDNFDAIGQWLVPKLSGNSVGIDTTRASWISTSAVEIYSGKYSARVGYKFINASGGVCEYLDGAKPSINAATTNFGMWVFGDASKNLLEYSFSQNGTITNVFVDTINWTGWKIKKIPVSAIPGTGEKLFNSIIVKQTPNSRDSSVIYIDDVQYDITLTNPATSVQGQTGYVAPTNYSLGQNYPNPFNPSTIIKWHTASAGKVTLKVYDVLGRVVATLLDGDRPAGDFQVSFDAGKLNLASGVYLYKLQAGTFTETKKMILSK